jgi:hypothetical protein
MNGCCPVCRRDWPEALRLEAALLDLRARCADLGIVPESNMVSEPDAAALLGKSSFTVRNWRQTDRRLDFVRVGGSIRYELATLAAFIAEGRENDD